MPKQLRTLEDHTADIITSRRRGSGGRFRAVPAGTERAADVVEAACAQVAGAFKDLGFCWSASGLSFSRRVGGFRQIVSFQRDGANLSGAYVAVVMHAQVKSKELAAWRETNGVTTGENVWSTQVGYLSEAHEYLKWQLVDPVGRLEEIASMIDTVRNLVFPAFEAASSQAALAMHLLDRREMTWTPHWAMDIALWSGNRTAAGLLLRSYLKGHLHQVPAFQERYALELATPSLAKPLRPTDCMAWVCAKHGLDPANVV